MSKPTPPIGSSFERRIDETGLCEEVTAIAVTSVMAAQIAEEMRKQGISKTAMAAPCGDRPRPARRAARSRERQRYA